MKLTTKTRIGVLLGGLSKERDVSLRTGKGLATALRNRGYESVDEIDVGYDIGEVLTKKKVEVAVIALHGRFGEDGALQGLLEFLRIPYTGEGIVTSAVCMDKVLSKKLFIHNGVRTPAYFVADAQTDPKNLNSEIEKLGFPVIAKPVMEGSTIGLSIVKKPEQIPEAQKLGLRHDDRVLWEQFIEGSELTVGILNGEPLPVVEIVPKSGLYDYTSKYTKGATDYYAPARISESATNMVQAEARRAFEAVQAKSFGRVDVILSKKGEPWVLEINTIPGMTETSLFPKAAQAAGISYEEMTERILKDARLKI
jgi:D-alanine-D-alanine ligase